VVPVRWRAALWCAVVAASMTLASCQGAGTATPGNTGAPTVGASTAAPTNAPPSPTPMPLLPQGRLVFTRYSGDAEGPFVGFYVLDAGQSTATKLELPITVDGASFAAWSPDGAQLVVNLYRSETGGRPATIGLDGSDFHFLEPEGLKGDLECTDWSGDGKRLMCGVNSPDPKLDGVYELTVDGVTLRRLTTSPYHYTEGSAGGCGGGDGRGVYSPDETRFAFIRQKCGNGPDPSSDEEAALVVGKLSGGALTVIIQRGVRTHGGSQLSWSPDGQWIAYDTQGLDLALVHPDGSDNHVIDVHIAPLRVLGPAWSPDGRAVVFGTLNNDRLGNMYLVAPDGSGAIVVPGTLSGAFPNWTGP
jgi:hypothetical protein